MGIFRDNGYMARIPTKDELKELYIDKKQSLSEIAIKLGFKTHKVIYWMDKYGIVRRKRSEANYIKHNPDGEPFCIKTRLTRDEVKLKYLALGLYWGEGNKTTSYAVRVTNSDPGVIKQFMLYLRIICRAKEDKFGYYLQTFKDNDLVKARKYWGRMLGIDPDTIKTTKPIHSMGKGTYKKICKHGVMTVGFFNTHLKSYIMNELGKLGMK
ncbi:TPA: hypothetical protein DCS00_03320 [Candidatus Collierbacteria bacterium]|nr:hypothetical protein [Candidatus Collierbacteria bacterium]